MITVHINYDHDTPSPCDDTVTWRLRSFNRRHTAFTDPKSLRLSASLDPETGEPTVYDPGLRRRLAVGLAFWLSYYEHGQSAWFLKGGPYPAGVEFQWDGCRLAGLLVWEHGAKSMGARSYESRAEDAAGFLETYNQWANGETYWYRVAEDREDRDSCGGFIGAESVAAAVAESLRHLYPDRDDVSVVFAGNSDETFWRRLIEAADSELTNTLSLQLT